MTGVLVNTDLVKAGQEPKAYKDFADPRWKDNIIALTPKISGMGNYWYTIIGRGVLGTKPYAGPDYLDKMNGQKVRWVNNYDDGANLVARGEAPVYFPVLTVSAARLREAKAPIKFLQMTEGSFASQYGWGVVKNAPHPNAAKLFINWLGTMDGQKALDAMGDIPLRSDAPVSIPENETKGVTLLWFETDESDAALYPALKEAEDFFGLK